MINAVTVTNYLGDSIKLELVRPGISGFAIQSITGLGPGKADINTTEISTNDGGSYNSARMSKRNIVISIRYYEGDTKKTIEELRHMSYKYFPIKKQLKLLIESDFRISEIQGYVEENDPDIFSKAESTDISIICPDPFFYSAGPDGTNTTVFYGVEALFTFPFSNESLTEPLLFMGEIQNKTENYIYYNGDAEIGIIIDIHAVGTATGLVIYNTQTREVMRINTDKIAEITGSGIIAKDDIRINTIKGQKGITLLRDGVSINILNCLEKDVDWFHLAKGDNIFAYTAETGATNLQFTIENRVIYEGV